MTPAGWIFLVLAFSFVLTGLVICFYWTIRADERKKRAHPEG